MPSTTASAVAAPRPAASLVVLRDGPGGLETLLLQRAPTRDQTSGAWVFPGGIVDRGDAAWAGGGLDASEADARLGLAEGGLAYHVAAVRECFEECGLLFATDAAGRSPHWPAGAASPLHAWREALHRGTSTLAGFCAASGTHLALDRLAYIGHWLTPPGLPKRYDTRFFVAIAPPGQEAAPDGAELLARRWLRPADALAQAEALKLMGPTRAMLRDLAPFDSAEAALAWAREPRDIRLVMPRIGTGRAGVRPVHPSEFAWAEIGRLDPGGRGDVHYDIRPEVAVRLSPRLIRVTADNGSVMTGPGTNSYLVGGGERNEWAVIDPGPPSETHVQAILAAAPGPIRWIFATHTHTDHSPACALLHQATGALVHGRRPAHAEWQDASFAPDVLLAGGERVELPGCDATLRVLHTPGHASNHLCYLLEEERLLFTGDHVMQASTVVINPPDGDMRAYLASLRELLGGEALDWLAPGHGFLMAEPKRAFEAIIAHRLRREAKVLAALQALGPADEAALLARVYDDVAPQLHAPALRSLRAHLGKLRDDGVADEAGGAWRALAGPH